LWCRPSSRCSVGRRCRYAAPASPASLTYGSLRTALDWRRSPQPGSDFASRTRCRWTGQRMLTASWSEAGAARPTDSPPEKLALGGD
jgi:hypothetical protein